MEIDLSQYESDKKIIDICSDNMNIDGTYCVIQEYKYDHSAMMSRGIVPFLFKDGKYLWNVKTNLLTKRDIYNTFPNISETGTDVIEIHFYNQVQRNVESEIKNAREQFWKLWKDEVKRWKDMHIHMKDRRRFKAFLKRFNVSPMSVIQAVYTEESYNIDEFGYRFGCDEKESCSVLKCLGYFINPAVNYIPYELNRDFYDAVNIICDNVNGIIQETSNYEQNSHLKQTLYRFYTNAESFFKTQKDKTVATTDVAAYREEPAVGERQNYFEIVIYAIVIILLIAIILIVLLITEGQSDIGALSNFIGALVGAAISGFFVIMTTRWMINRSYKIDYHDERINVIPVFSAQCFNETAFNEYKVVYEHKSLKTLNIEDIGEYDPPMYMVCNNVGNGIAFCVNIYPRQDDQNSFDAHTIPVNDCAAVKLEKRTLNDLYIKYRDLYGNLYHQHVQITVYNDKDEIEVIEQPPELIMRTKRARYSQ